ncbi:hypothetical protein BC829DRAFT_492064 [Chytridium lagenaria]|nr:hypothetical protein BC829DRAFT_492064 [Chytridium lagenaria]
MPPLSAAGASKTSAAVVSASVEAHQLPPSSSTSVACSLPSSGISSTSSVTASFAPKPMVSQSAPSSSTSQSSVSGVAVSAVSSEGLHVHHHHHLHHHHHHHHHIVIAAPSPHHPSPSSPSTDVRTQNSTSAGTPASASVIDMKRTASTSSASNASPISPSNSYSVGTGSFSGVTSTAPTALALACGAGNGIEATTASTSMKLSAPSYAGGNVSASSSAVGPTGHHHQHPLTTSSGSGRLSVDMGAFWKPSMQQQQGGGVVMGGPTPLSLLHYHHATTAILGHSSTSLNQPPSNAIPMSTYMPLVEPSFFETIPMPEASALNWGEQSMPMMSADSLLKLAGSGLHQPILHVHLLSKKAASCSFFVELVNIAVNESMISEGPSSSTKRSRRPHRRRFQAAKLPGEKASSCLSSVIAQIRKNKRQYQIASDATSTSIPFPLPSTHPASYFSFPRLSSPSSARSSDDLLASTQARLAEANVRRLTRLHDRQTSIARRFEHVRYRVLLLRQGQRLAALKLRARSEYAMSAASLKRQLILKQSVDRYGAAVEHAQTVAMLHRLRKFLALRRAFSESALAASFSSAAAALERKADESSMDEEDGDDDVSEISPRHRALLASAFDGDVHHDAVGFLAHRGGSGEPHITTSELLSRAAGLLHPDPRHRLRVAGSDAWVLPAPIARGLEARVVLRVRNTNDALRQKRKKVRRKFSQDQRVETSGNSLAFLGLNFGMGRKMQMHPSMMRNLRECLPLPAFTFVEVVLTGFDRHDGRSADTRGLIGSSSASSILGLQQHAAHMKRKKRKMMTAWRVEHHFSIGKNWREFHFSGPPAGDLWAGSPSARRPLQPYKSDERRSRSSSSNAASRSSTVTAKLSLSFAGIIKALVDLESAASHPRDSHDDPMVGVRLTLDATVIKLVGISTISIRLFGAVGFTSTHYEFTLRELDMDELRHDLYFDPNLQFKPNVEGERGEQKRLLSTQYWTEVEAEVRAGYLFRIPLLLYEIRCIIVELLPYSEEMREDVERNIDVRLIAQQMEHGVLGLDI